MLRNFVGNPLSVSLLLGAEKVWIRERWEYQDYLSKIFCLTVPKNFVGEPFCGVFQKKSGGEKVNGWQGGKYQDFPSKTFCITVTRNFARKPFSVSLLLGAEKVWIREGLGSIKMFCRKFSVSQC